MAAQSLLAKLGMRCATLGTAASLAIAAPLSEGNPSMGAHTDASRIGQFYDRTAGAEKQAFVTMGVEQFAVGADSIILRQQAGAPATPADGMVWITSAGMFVRAGGATSGPFAAGGGTVTSVSVVTANGVSGSVATATTTPAITLTLGAITPSSVASTGLITGTNLRSGTGTPEGVVTAAVGALFERTDGSTGTTLYIKETGAGNTGWVPVAASGGTIGGSIAVNQVAFGSGANTIQGSAKITFTTATGLVVNMASSGADNLTIGSTAGDSLSSGTQNVLLGSNAGTALTTQSNNTAVGFSALTACTASDNVAVGTRAADAVTSSTRVVAIGTDALGAGIAGVSDSTAIGFNALILATGLQNTATGSSAGSAITTATDNTLVGYQAGANLTTIGFNTFIGSQAGSNLLGLTAFTNVAIGYQAMQGSGTVASNIPQASVAIGQQALQNVTSGGFNVAIGLQSMNALTTAARCVGVGQGTLINVNGNNNVAIGHQAGNATTSGTDNIFLGYAAGDSTSNSASNRMVVGSNSSNITNVFFGNGETNVAPVAVTFGVTGGSGSNVAGAAHNIAGGIGTGTGVGGAINFRTAKATTSGSTANTLVTAVSVLQDGAFDWTGIATVSAPAVSATSHGTIFFDSTTNTFKTSVNGGAYASLGTGTIGGAATSGQVSYGSGSNTITSNSTFLYATTTGLSVNRAGTRNEFFGLNAGNATTSQSDDVVIGNGAGTAITTGTGSNTIIGSTAGTGITSGADNTVVGYAAFGAGSGTGNGNNNSYFGSVAGNFNTTGTRNCGFGVSSLGAVTTNGSNTAMGWRSLFSNTVADNVAFGSQAGNTTSTSARITALGTRALRDGSTGISDSTAVGYQALILATGLRNTALGSSAGALLTTGTDNIFLGSDAGDSTAVGASNRMVVGSSTSSITAIYIGKGETNAAPAGVVLNVTGGSGSNIAGASLTIAGGISTGSGAGGSVIIQTSPATGSSSTPNTLTTRLTADQLGNVVVGSAALATNATDGFLYIPTCAGTPTGVPTAFAGRDAMIYDTTANKFWMYNGAWRGIVLV